MPFHRKYLLFIDDAPIDTAINDYFSKFDYSIERINSFSELEQSEYEPSAILINSSLLNGNIEPLLTLFERFPVPIIVFSIFRDETLCVKMLEAGADDFLIKPFLPRELHARINAISRRVQKTKKAHEGEREVLAFADYRVYPASRQVFDNRDNELSLSAGEYDLLLAFIHRPQQVLPREFLLQATKQSDLNPFDRRIDVQISRLRQKIEIDAKRPLLIKTIRNGGYLFTAPVSICREFHAE